MNTKQEKVIVITGATSGIGLSTIKNLAKSRHFVIGIGRSGSLCRKLEGELRNETENENIYFITCNLALQKNIEMLAENIEELLLAKNIKRIDSLINNAGTVTTWFTSTEEGHELQFAVNHLAPFYLTHKLLPFLKKSNDARIITVSSNSHKGAKISWNDIELRSSYNCLKAYKQSKLANILFIYELNKILSHHKNIRAYAVDPGLVKTDIGLKGTGGLEKYVWKLRMRGGVSPCVPAITIKYLATENISKHKDSLYWKDCKPARTSKYAQNAIYSGRLWSLSSKMCGIESYL